MKIDPYEMMALPRDATPAAIKARYRVLAQQLHPDKGGDEANFKELGDAYEILSNPERRAHYDAHGHGPSLAQEASTVLNGIFEQYIHSTDERDPVTSITSAMEQQITAQLAAVQDLTNKLNRLERYLKNLKRKKDGQDDTLGDIMRRQQLQLSERKRVAEHGIAVCKLVIEQLAQWEIPGEAPANPYRRPRGQTWATLS